MAIRPRCWNCKWAMWKPGPKGTTYTTGGTCGYLVAIDTLPTAVSVVISRKPIANNDGKDCPTWSEIE